MSDVVSCPICSQVIQSTEERVINAHIDECLTQSFLNEGGGGLGSSGGGRGGGLGSSGGGAPDMDALLAQELGQSPDLIEGGLTFKFTCPYPACNQTIIAYEFCNHAKQYHSSCTQQYGCPICEAETGVTYEANENTNLLQHLNNAHADMSEMQRVMMESRKAFLYQLSGRVELPTTVGHGRTVKILEKTMEGKECSICFEEFIKGDKVTFLECLCMYHEHCLDEWFEKKQKEVCPFHRDQDD